MKDDSLARDMYKEHILELYKDPPNFGILKNPTSEHRAHNPLCGDDISVGVQVKDGILVDAKFHGKGCAISIASAALVIDSAIGKKISEIKAWQKEHALELLGIPVGPVRMKCALIGLEALHKAIER